MTGQCGRGILQQIQISTHSAFCSSSALPIRVNTTAQMLACVLTFAPSPSSFGALLGTCKVPNVFLRIIRARAGNLQGPCCFSNDYQGPSRSPLVRSLLFFKWLLLEPKQGTCKDPIVFQMIVRAWAGNLQGSYHFSNDSLLLSLLCNIYHVFHCLNIPQNSPNLKYKSHLVFTKCYNLLFWISTARWHCFKGKCVLAHNSHILCCTFKILIKQKI